MLIYGKNQEMTLILHLKATRQVQFCSFEAEIAQSPSFLPVIGHRGRKSPRNEELLDLGPRDLVQSAIFARHSHLGRVTALERYVNREKALRFSNLQVLRFEKRRQPPLRVDY